MEIATNPALLPPRPVEAEAGAGEAEATASADFSSFLSLLTAQLRNQDPLQPLDSTQFVAQLASFSTVEQLIGTNRRLDTLAAEAERDGAGLYAGWIGREAALIDGSFRGTGAEVRFAYAPEPGADRAVAVVSRGDGQPVASVPLDPLAAEPGVWTGLDATGAAVTGPLTLRIGYFDGETLVAERPAAVFREIVGIAGTESGPRIAFADGGDAAPEAVAALRAAPVEET